jgi:hypothetical protein
MVEIIAGVAISPRKTEVAALDCAAISPSLATLTSPEPPR